MGRYKGKFKDAAKFFKEVTEVEE